LEVVILAQAIRGGLNRLLTSSIKNVKRARPVRTAPTNSTNNQDPSVAAELIINSMVAAVDLQAVVDTEIFRNPARHLAAVAEAIQVALVVAVMAVGDATGNDASGWQKRTKSFFVRPAQKQ
jgi:hypothetical protein